MQAQPILDSSAPLGEAIVHNGRKFIIQPIALSGKTIKVMRRESLAMRRAEARELLTTQGLSKQTRDAIIAESLKPMAIGFAEAANGLQVPEVLAEVLAIACGISQDEATELVDNFPAYDQLMLATMRAMGIAALKNYAPPQKTAGASEVEQPQDDQGTA